MKKFLLTVALALLATTNLLAAGSLKKIIWEYAGSIPAQKGYEKNVGVAAGLSGIIGKYVVFGGGANFVMKSLSEGGAKVIHKGLAPEIPKFFPKNSYSIGKSIRRAIISNKFKIV